MDPKSDIEALGQVVPPSAEAIIDAAKKFPPVTPNVHSENYQYTIFFPSGAVEVTASERSVKELWKRLSDAPEGVVFFPEAVVKAHLIEAVIAGWDEGGDDEDEEEDEPDEPEEKPVRRLKKARAF